MTTWVGPNRIIIQHGKNHSNFPRQSNNKASKGHVSYCSVKLHLAEQYEHQKDTSQRKHSRSAKGREGVGSRASPRLFRDGRAEALPSACPPRFPPPSNAACFSTLIAVHHTACFSTLIAVHHTACFSTLIAACFHSHFLQRSRAPANGFHKRFFLRGLEAMPLCVSTYPCGPAWLEPRRAICATHSICSTSSTHSIISIRAKSKPKARLRLYRCGRVEARLDCRSSHPSLLVLLLSPFVARQRHGVRGWAVEPRLDSFVTVEPKPCLRLVPPPLLDPLSELFRPANACLRLALLSSCPRPAPRAFSACQCLPSACLVPPLLDPLSEPFQPANACLRLALSPLSSPFWHPSMNNLESMAQGPLTRSTSHANRLPITY